jgi:uncharacterized protein YbjT (DUF2867 family)
MDKTVLVIGATGRLGEPVAQHLKEDGFRVRVMTRDSNKARGIFGETFDVVVGDIMDAGSLEEPLDGCFGVHISTPYPPENEQMKVNNVIAVASKKGLQRITYVSWTFATEGNLWFPHAKQKFLAEEIIRESGIPYTIFCPTTAMENIPMFVQGNWAAVIGKQAHPYHWFAADDFGRMVSASYGLEETVNKRLCIHGPEAILTHEAVRQYFSIFHPKITKILTLPYWVVRIMVTIIGSKEMKFGSSLWAVLEKVDEGDSTEANRILGAPKTTLDEWLKQRKVKLGMASVD